MKNLIMTDLDGTLFKGEDNTLNQNFVQKIINFTNNGNMFAVNSARPYDALKRWLAPLFSRTVFICNDGAQIMYQNCLVYKKLIDSTCAKNVCSMALSNHITAFAVTRESSLSVESYDLNNPGFWGEDIYKIILIKNKNSTNIDKVKAFACGLGLKVCYEDSTYLELNSATVNKGTACDIIKQKYNINGIFYAFGDSAFDLSMLQKADLSFVVKNSKGFYSAGAKQIDNMQNYILLNF